MDEQANLDFTNNDKDFDFEDELYLEIKGSIVRFKG